MVHFNYLVSPFKKSRWEEGIPPAAQQVQKKEQPIFIKDHLNAIAEFLEFDDIARLSVTSKKMQQLILPQNEHRQINPDCHVLKKIVPEYLQKIYQIGKQIYDLQRAQDVDIAEEAWKFEDDTVIAEDWDEYGFNSKIPEWEKAIGKEFQSSLACLKKEKNRLKTIHELCELTIAVIAKKILELSYKWVVWNDGESDFANSLDLGKIWVGSDAYKICMAAPFQLIKALSKGLRWHTTYDLPADDQMGKIGNISERCFKFFLENDSLFREKNLDGGAYYFRGLSIDQQPLGTNPKHLDSILSTLKANTIFETLNFSCNQFTGGSLKKIYKFCDEDFEPVALYLFNNPFNGADIEETIKFLQNATTTFQLYLNVHDDARPLLLKARKDKKGEGVELMPYNPDGTRIKNE
jgi:hypothetical protein